MRLTALAFAATLGVAFLPGEVGAVPAAADLGATPHAGIVEVWGGCGPGWRPVGGYWDPWRGWVPPYCAPARGYWGRHHWRHRGWRHHHRHGRHHREHQDWRHGS